MLSRLFIAALWSPTGKGLDLLALVGDNLLCFVTFPCGILGQVWHLIVLIPDLCPLSYFTDSSILQYDTLSFLQMVFYIQYK